VIVIRVEHIHNLAEHGDADWLVATGCHDTRKRQRSVVVHAKARDLIAARVHGKECVVIRREHD